MEDLVDDLMEVVMMIKRTRMRLVVAIRTKGETIPIISMTKTMEIREEEEDEEEECKDLEEEVFVEKNFTTEKKGIENLNVPSAKEGQNKE